MIVTASATIVDNTDLSIQIGQIIIRKGCKSCLGIASQGDIVCNSGVTYLNIECRVVGTILHLEVHGYRRYIAPTFRSTACCGIVGIYINRRTIIHTQVIGCACSLALVVGCRSRQSVCVTLCFSRVVITIQILSCAIRFTGGIIMCCLLEISYRHASICRCNRYGSIQNDCTMTAISCLRSTNIGSTWYCSREAITVTGDGCTCSAGISYRISDSSATVVTANQRTQIQCRPADSIVSVGKCRCRILA